jgi:hypothetical protein
VINCFIRQEYPKISYITKCRVVSSNPRSGNSYDDVGPTVEDDAARTTQLFDENDLKWKRVRSASDRRRTSNLDRIYNDVQGLDKRNAMPERLKDEISVEKRRGYLDFNDEKVDKFDALELRRKLNRNSGRLARRSKFDDEDEDE